MFRRQYLVTGTIFGLAGCTGSQRSTGNAPYDIEVLDGFNSGKAWLVPRHDPANTRTNDSARGLENINNIKEVGRTSSVPLYFDNTLYLGGKPVTAVRDDGRQSWTAGYNKKAKVIGVSPDSVYLSKVFKSEAGSGNEVVALSREDGSVKWKRQLGGPAHPLLVGNCIFIPQDSQTKIVAIEAQSGENIWTVKDANVDAKGGIAYKNETIFAGGLGGNISAWDASVGKKRWEHQVSGMRVQPVVGHQLVYAGTTNGKVVAIDFESGEKIWEKQVLPSKNGFALAGPALSEDALIMPANNSGTTSALNPTTGEELWSIETGSSYVEPATDGSSAYLAGANEYFTVDLSSGEINWRQAHESLSGTTYDVKRNANGLVVIDDAVYNVSNSKVIKIE